MVLPRGSVDDVGGRESDPRAGDGGVRDSDEVVPGIGGGARSFGQTGEVLSRKNRLQVRFSGERACVTPKSWSDEFCCRRNLYSGVCTCVVVSIVYAIACSPC